MRRLHFVALAALGSTVGGTVFLPGAANAASSTPANGRLLYADGTSGFETVASDGTQPTHVAIVGGGWNTSHVAGNPVVSPDGSRVVFEDQTASSVWVCNMDGTGARELIGPGTSDVAGTPVANLDFNPLWADNSTVLFARTTHSYQPTSNPAVVPTTTIMSVKLDGTGLKAFLKSPGTDDYPVSTSANGLLLYATRISGQMAYQVTDLATGTTTKPVTAPYVQPNYQGAFRAKLSPDGTRLLAIQDTDWTLHVTNLDGSNSILIPRFPASYSQAQDFGWSPDGQRVEWVADMVPAAGVNQYEIFVRGLGATDPTTNIVPPGGASARGVGWLPAGATPPPPSPTPIPTPPTPTPAPAPTPPAGNGPKVYRDAGQTRVETGIVISQQRRPAAGSAQAVVLATSRNFPDALSGGPLAAKKNGPLLLTDGLATQAAPGVLAEIRRVLPVCGEIYVLGGDGAMNPAIVTQLKSLGYAVTQYKGSDRADTALQVARDGMGSPTHVIVATGTGFADALASGPYAAGPFADAPGAPAAIVLSNGPTLDAATRAFLTGRTVATVGAPAGRAWPGAAKSFPGSDRFDTAARVAAEFTGANVGTQVGVANGVAAGNNPGYPDALTGGAFMAESNGPIVLVDGIGGVLPDATKAVLAARTGNVRADIFGGPAVVPPTLAAQIVSVLHGTAQF